MTYTLKLHTAENDHEVIVNFAESLPREGDRIGIVMESLPMTEGGTTELARHNHTVSVTTVGVRFMGKVTGVYHAIGHEHGRFGRHLSTTVHADVTIGLDEDVTDATFIANVTDPIVK